jgi:hypothetical protein
LIVLKRVKVQNMSETITIAGIEIGVKAGDKTRTCDRLITSAGVKGGAVLRLTEHPKSKIPNPISSLLLKYISDVFQELYDDLAARRSTEYTDSEGRDEYMGSNVFWVPKESRWANIQAHGYGLTPGRYVTVYVITAYESDPTLWQPDFRTRKKL